MFIILEVQLGSNAGKRFRITPSQHIRVGRSSRADLALPKDQFLSSIHFSLENDPEKCWISDLNSRNGTFVNGQRVQRTALNDGDTVLAGFTAFAVRMSEDDVGDSGTPHSLLPSQPQSDQRC
jgi:eukaryotic-like serine/threonine-protein kinase